MLRLILIRHGLTEWNVQRRYQGQTDVPLSELGKRQAQLVAERLVDQKFDAIYASDLGRAWETAQPVAKLLGVQVVSEPRLRELKFGIFEGLTYDEAVAQYPEMMAAWLEDFKNTPEGAETIDAFIARIVALLNDLKAKHDEQTVLLVGHGGSLSEILRVVLGLSRKKRWHLEIGHTSISEILIAEDYVALQRLNDTCHLKELL
jgi:alpha-ribazole phosphatase